MRDQKNEKESLEEQNKECDKAEKISGIKWRKLNKDKLLQRLRNRECAISRNKRQKDKGRKTKERKERKLINSKKEICIKRERKKNRKE